jgi:hypothetical protein
MGTDVEVEELIPTKDVKLEEELYDRREYDGDNDFGPAEVTPESDDVGTGAIIASSHIESEQDNNEVIYIATMAALNNPKSNNVTVVMELIKSIKEDYETRGSGLKPRPMGRTNQQLKANSAKEWASNSNIKSIKPGSSSKTPIQRQVKVNGMEAYTCWDSGLELDAISPDFS